MNPPATPPVDEATLLAPERSAEVGPIAESPEDKSAAIGAIRALMLQCHDGLEMQMQTKFRHGLEVLQKQPVPEDTEIVTEELLEFVAVRVQLRLFVSRLGFVVYTTLRNTGYPPSGFIENFDKSHPHIFSSLNTIEQAMAAFNFPRAVELLELLLTNLKSALDQNADELDASIASALQKESY